MSLADWTESSSKFEAFLAKYAHGDIEDRIQDVINNSLIVADILELYFKK